MTCVHCTRPSGGGKRKLPFAALPHDLVADSRLTPTDKTLAALVLRFARHKDHAWPSNRRLARDLGRSVRTVQLALGRLRDAGWIAVEHGDNPTGRLIILAWRRQTDCAPEAQPVAPPPAQPVAPERNVGVERNPRNPDRAGSPQRQRAGRPTPSTTSPPMVPPGRSPAPPRELPAGLRAWLDSDDPILRAEAERAARGRAAVRRPPPESVEELLGRLPEDPSFPARAAEALSRRWRDPGSWSGYLRLCERVWRGEIGVEGLVEAYRRADGPGVARPGALLWHLVKRGDPAGAGRGTEVPASRRPGGR